MAAVDLHCEIEGSPDLPPVVLAGSLGTTLAMWEPQLRALSGTARMIAVDHRGHGRSPAPPGPYSIADLASDVLALLDTLELERVSWCGLSLGGMVGQWLAINAPARIDRLILVSTSAHLPPPENWIERAAVVRAAGTTEPLADTVLGRWFTEPYAREHPEVVSRVRAMVVATPAEGYAGCCEAISELDLRSGLATITAPTVVIAGRQDPSTPLEHTRAIAEAVPGARLEVLDPGAHLVSIERAHEVSALIGEHLRP
jgi:3-oxoadipate enol-lactonase